MLCSFVHSQNKTEEGGWVGAIGGGGGRERCYVVVCTVPWYIMMLMLFSAPDRPFLNVLQVRVMIKARLRYLHVLLKSTFNHV